MMGKNEQSALYVQLANSLKNLYHAICSKTENLIPNHHELNLSSIIVTGSGFLKEQ